MIEFGERYYDEWLGYVYSILLDGNQIGSVDYEEKENEVTVNILSLYRQCYSFEYFKESVDIIKSMFPKKKMTGLVGISCLCGELKDWKALGAKTYPDPDDDIFTVFELQ